MLSDAQLQVEALRLLEAVDKRRTEFTPFEHYFKIRTSEFLLLATRLRSRQDFACRRVLDVGCGNGYSLALWSLLAENLVGMDRPDVLEGAHRLLDSFARKGVTTQLVPSATDWPMVDLGTFDLILTQYALEHVGDINGALQTLKRLVSPEGYVVHVLPGLADRHDWYIAYRMQTSLFRRLRDSLRERGLLGTLADPVGFTTPHEPRYGSFSREQDEYRLETWTLQVMASGFQVMDYFQTRDVNWVLVTRPMA